MKNTDQNKKLERERKLYSDRYLIDVKSLFITCWTNIDIHWEKNHVIFSSFMLDILCKLGGPTNIKYEKF